MMNPVVQTSSVLPTHMLITPICFCHLKYISELNHLPSVVEEDCRRLWQLVIYSLQHAQTSTRQTVEGPAEDALISPCFCPLFHSQDRWRDTCSCLNITFPVLCSSSHHSCAPPRAFSVPGPTAAGEGEFRREQLFCRDAHIWCCVVSQRQSGRGLGITPGPSSSEL